MQIGLGVYKVSRMVLFSHSLTYHPAYGELQPVLLVICSINVDTGEVHSYQIYRFNASLCALIIPLGAQNYHDTLL